MYPEVFEARRFFEEDEFYSKMFDCCVANYFDLNNPIRFNNFAYATRELLSNFLTSDNENDSEIIKCDWFKGKKDPKTGKITPTDRERIRYTLLGAIPDTELGTEKKTEFNKLYSEYDKTKGSLNSYTHIDIVKEEIADGSKPSKMDIDLQKGDDKFRDILKLVINLMAFVKPFKKN